MAQTEVIIVGAGPSGLGLALALSRRRIKCVLLEASKDICKDPRAIALSGDTVRIFQLLGVTSQEFQHIGQPVRDLNFHYGVFTSEPFLTLDHNFDHIDQGVSMGLVIFQPKLEEAMRNLVNASEFATLKTECEVISCNEFEDSVAASYKTKDGSTEKLKGKFLVGADGKRGVVRKHFLEGRGIKQVVGQHEYEATWVAANLLISMPTPSSHPDFAVWQLGYKPKELWDLFWPPGFHFCNHPTMPVAAGRFGPADGKYWRFEYELPAGRYPVDLEEDLKAQVLPHLRIPSKRLRNGSTLKADIVEFPWDCVKIIRCQAVLFTHKVVNRWFDNRMLLIGDAAHVFPPFGAQGIANGVRDAFALSWRMGLLLQPGRFQNGDQVKELLNVWSQERRRGVDQASQMTMQNGRLLRNKSWVMAELTRIGNKLLKYSVIRDPFLRWLLDDSEGLRYAKRGNFLLDFQGGGKIAQIWVQQEGPTNATPKMLSDELFWNHGFALALLFVGNQLEELEFSKWQTILQSLDSPMLIYPEIMAISFNRVPSSTVSHPGLKQYYACIDSDVRVDGMNLIPGYDPTAFLKRFGPRTRYVLVRPDFIIFSQASSLDQVDFQVRKAKSMLGTDGH
ncbi:uncharacterized protein Z518_08893 [Rhinocladiella mackenziei CBS 650.93]|uniref:FAD-binding domain-containing protein n=1 Tax=Rhinocladiella mackenziei CBS 650.93 TaxID=1442369 RepID=A0A0D2GS67_9EURO|nr:uncharacterized protein Z518_08893 [Rhinocladiella mackenziei CBS 650.93]KIX01168.1 hypothetical protein Z518_08893 [Rhinocladiella mackenziei CBS 650.93]